MNVLAFDSGVERTGYAVFTQTERDPELIDYGCIFTSKDDTHQKRLADIRDEVENLVKKHKPEVFVLERLFFNNNITTGIAVAQSQGAVISLAGSLGLEVDYLTPQQIKESVAGYGNADKKAVQKMVKILLELEEVPKPDDTADAIACGLTYCTMRSFHDRQT